MQDKTNALSISIDILIMSAHFIKYVRELYTGMGAYNYIQETHIYELDLQHAIAHISYLDGF